MEQFWLLEAAIYMVLQYCLLLRNNVERIWFTLLFQKLMFIYTFSFSKPNCFPLVDQKLPKVLLTIIGTLPRNLIRTIGMGLAIQEKMLLHLVNPCWIGR